MNKDSDSEFIKYCENIVILFEDSKYYGYSFTIVGHTMVDFQKNKTKLEASIRSTCRELEQMLVERMDNIKNKDKITSFGIGDVGIYWNIDEESRDNDIIEADIREEIHDD